MHSKTFSKILVSFIVASMMTATICSSSTFMVFAQAGTFDDILAELEALNSRLDELEANVTDELDSVKVDITAINSALGSLSYAIDTIESILYSISATTASSAEIAILDSALDTLNELTTDIQFMVESLNTTAATKSELAALSSTVDEMNTTLDQVEANIDYLRNVVATKEDLESTRNELSKSLDTLQLLLIVALILALVAAIAAVAAVYIVLKKGAKIQK